MARIRGRVTGTRRPAEGDRPVAGAVPHRRAIQIVAARRPAHASTSAFIIAAITCSPAPTVIASRPSCTSPANSAIATLTDSGTRDVALTALFW